MSLSEKALLVNLKISQWTARKFDKRATATVAVEHRTEQAAGNYTKKLLPGAKELEEIQRLAGSIRTFYYDNTLPWCADGARILPSQNYLDFANEFRKRKGEFDHAVGEFLREYPTLKEQARAKLGDLFQETEYKTVDYLRDAFACDIAYMPLPDVKDFRVDLSDNEKEKFLKNMREVEQNARRECWTRLHDVVSKAASRLAEPDARFRESLIENIREMCALLPKLNVMGDSNLETLRAEVESLVAGISVDDCRQQPDARAEAARALDDITAKMGAFMGS